MNLSSVRLFHVFVFLLLSSCATNEIKDESSEVKDIEINEAFGVDEDIKALFDESVAALKEKKYKEAIELLKKVTANDTKHSAPFVNLGIAYLNIGDVELSEKSFKQALTINPDHPVTNNELGIVYRKSGRFDDARKLYVHVINKYPLFLPARKNLAILCDIFIKDLECAIQHYSKYLELKPDAKKVQIWLKDVTRRAKIK